MESASDMYRRSSLLTAHMNNGLLRPLTLLIFAVLFSYPYYPQLETRHFGLFGIIILRHFIY